MSRFEISSLKDFDIAPDGRKAVLNFADDQDLPVSLKFTQLQLEQLAHELGFVLTKARQLSEASKQGMAPFLRPARCRGGASPGEPTVIVSFQLPSGLEMHYGLEPIVAEGLAKQLHDGAQEAKTAKPPTRN
jgi:hypothetical protein